MKRNKSLPVLFLLINYIRPLLNETRQANNHLTQMCGTVQMFKNKENPLTTYKGFHIFLPGIYVPVKAPSLPFIIKFEDITQL